MKHGRFLDNDEHFAKMKRPNNSRILRDFQPRITHPPARQKTALRHLFAHDSLVVPVPRRAGCRQYSVFAVQSGQVSTQ
jgi:hypothetical protein